MDTSALPTPSLATTNISAEWVEKHLSLGRPPINIEKMPHVCNFCGDSGHTSIQCTPEGHRGPDTPMDHYWNCASSSHKTSECSKWRRNIPGDSFENRIQQNNSWDGWSGMRQQLVPSESESGSRGSWGGLKEQATPEYIEGLPPTLKLNRSSLEASGVFYTPHALSPVIWGVDGRLELCPDGRGGQREVHEAPGGRVADPDT